MSRAVTTFRTDTTARIAVTPSAHSGIPSIVRPYSQAHGKFRIELRTDVHGYSSLTSSLSLSLSLSLIQYQHRALVILSAEGAKDLLFEVRRSAPPAVTSTPDNPQLSNRAIGVEPERYVGRIPERIRPGDAEQIVMPMLELSAHRAGLNRQAAIHERDRRRPVETVRVRPCIALERECRPGARDALALLRSLRRPRAVRQPLVHHPHLGAPVMCRRRRPDESIEHRVHQRVPQLGMVEVGEDRQAETAIRDQSHHRRAALDAAGVDRDKLAAVVLQDPAEAVRLEVRMREPRGRIERALHDLLRLEQLGEALRTYEAPARDPPAVEQKPQPFRHVGRGREDRAGGGDVVDPV